MFRTWMGLGCKWERERQRNCECLNNYNETSLCLRERHSLVGSRDWLDVCILIVMLHRPWTLGNVPFHTSRAGIRSLMMRPESISSLPPGIENMSVLWGDTPYNKHFSGHRHISSTHQDFINSSNALRRLLQKHFLGQKADRHQHHLPQPQPQSDIALVTARHRHANWVTQGVHTFQHHSLKPQQHSTPPPFCSRYPPSDFARDEAATATLIFLPSVEWRNARLLQLHSPWHHRQVRVLRTMKVRDTP